MNRTGLVALLSLLAAGCGTSPAPPVLLQLQVTPGTASVAAGYRVALLATAVYGDGRHADVTAATTWTSSDPAVATVAAGVVQSRAPGHVRVRATLDALTSGVDVRVTDAVLLGLEVQADATDVPRGTTVRARAAGTFSDGATRDVSGQAAWSCDGGRLAFEAAGLARAMALGPDRLVATVGELDGSVGVTVTAALLTEVRLRILEASLPVGATTQAVMEAGFTDGSVVDVSGDAVFGTNDASVLLLVGPARVLAVRQGQAEVTAVYQGQLAAAALLVTEAVPVELALLPPGLVLALGDSAPVIAVGHYSDECGRDDSEDVTWISADPAVATVSNLEGRHGLVWGVGRGQTTVIALHPERKLSAQALVVVGPPALDRIVITPRVPALAVEATLQLSAMGTFSDGSVADVAAQMTWTSWSPTVIWVDRGLVTGLTPGQGTVMAQDPSHPEIVAYVTVTVR